MLAGGDFVPDGVCFVLDGNTFGFKLCRDGVFKAAAVFAGVVFFVPVVHLEVCALSRSFRRVCIIKDFFHHLVCTDVAVFFDIEAQCFRREFARTEFKYLNATHSELHTCPGGGVVIRDELEGDADGAAEAYVFGVDDVAAAVVEDGTEGEF